MQTYTGEGTGLMIDTVLEIETEKRSIIKEITLIKRVKSDFLNQKKGKEQRYSRGRQVGSNKKAQMEREKGRRL